MTWSSPTSSPRRTPDARLVELLTDSDPLFDSVLGERRDTGCHRGRPDFERHVFEIAEVLHAGGDRRGVHPAPTELEASSRAKVAGRSLLQGFDDRIRTTCRSRRGGQGASTATAGRVTSCSGFRRPRSQVAEEEPGLFRFSTPSQFIWGDGAPRRGLPRHVH